MNMPRHYARRRRGIAVLWLILVLPIYLLLLGLVVEGGRLWTERAALENALESSVLAAVKQWGDEGALFEDIPQANLVGIAFARANLVGGRETLLGDENFVFGAVVSVNQKNVFHIGATGDGRQFRPCILCQARQSVPSLCGFLPGAAVSARTAACYDPDSRRARLIRIDEFRRRDVPVDAPGIP
jgi:hypothetical protein